MKSNLPSLETFVKDRNAALFSLDKKKILAYTKKYGVPLSTNETVFWASVFKAICNIESAPEALREKAVKWLHEHNFSEEINWCLTRLL